ncbi:glycine/betaine ABC transporter substrate-binding protein [Aerococcaceae bacterium zg-ZJ1578]|uniref:glycine betaine ABC transporter substrate-binding protein n=1 Tax=Aerococcaceae bacterium zg-252 TaxID=2796928 RepID=UPI001A245A17|nr:glycine/betaine ABC transporter substrate-binding protein [Aerococcaceae bacterium zg-1578]
MTTNKRIGGLFALLILLGLGLFSIMGHKQNSSLVGDKSIVRIGSKDFTENLIVAELYALALEDEGYKVDRKFNIASSLVHTSLVNKEIDLYPEYTGTGLLSILKLPLETDPEQVYQTVKIAYSKDFNLTWLDYAPATDSQGLVIRTAVAKEFGIKSISDLQEHADHLRFASQGEFDQREDGLVGLQTAYGDFNWKSSKVYDNSLKYSVLKNDEADVTPAYTTEGQLIQTEDFTLLEDDKSFWPPYNIAPVAQSELVRNHPSLTAVLNKISSKLTTEKLTELNAQVDVDGKEYSEVAKTFYDNIKE